MEDLSDFVSLSDSHSSYSSNQGMPIVLGNRHRVHPISHSDDDSSNNDISDEQSIHLNSINLNSPHPNPNLIHVNEIQTNFLPFMERIVHPMRHSNPYRNYIKIDSNESISDENELDGNYLQKKFNGVYKIIYIDEKEKYYLSSQRYYSNDQISDSKSAICAIKTEYEGQEWIIKKKYSGLYTIEYNEKEYEMQKWKINVQKGKKDLEVILSNDENSVFKFYKCENEKVVIQDGLTDLFLMVDKQRLRDKRSYYISLTNFLEKASKFSFVNPISFKENNIGINSKKKLGIKNSNKKI